MGRTRLRGIELAGVRVAVEVPADAPWDWSGTPHARFACPPVDPEVVVGVRRGRLHPRGRDTIAYACDGATFEVGRDGSDWEVAVRMRDRLERVARFDASFGEGEVVIAPDAPAGLAPLAHPLDEIIALHRIARAGGLVLRASAVFREGRALVFASQEPAEEERSSADAPGWRRISPPSLAGDRVVLRIHDSGVCAHGTPWQRDAHFGSPLRARLDAVHVIHPARAVYAERLRGAEAMAELLPFVLAPVHDPEGAQRFAAVAERMSHLVPVVRLGLPAEKRVVPFTWGHRQAALAFAPPFVS
jgi:hypothetical protein